MAIALKQGTDGNLQRFQAADSLQVDSVERLSSSGNLVIGSGLAGGEELQLGSAASTVRVVGAFRVSGSVEFSDSAFRIFDDGDDTKKIAFQASAITTATTRTITMPDADVNLASLVVGPASSVDNVIPRFSGTTGKVIQGGGADGVSDNPPTYDDSGNFYLDADSSTQAAPRIFGASGFSAAPESIRWELGDANNVVQNSFGGSMTIRAYHTLVLRGDHSGTGTTWDSESAIGVLVDNTTTTSPALVVRGAASQTGALQQWQSSTPTTLCQITAGGNFDLINHDVDNIRTGTFNSLITGSGAGGTINWANGQKQQWTMTGAGTFTFTAPPGPCNLMLALINAGANNPTWPGTVLWAGGTEPTWTSSGTDIVGFFYNGTSYYGVASLNFS